MQAKRLIACALAATLAFSPLGLLRTSAAAEGSGAELLLHSSFDDSTANDDSGKGNNGTVTSDTSAGGVTFVEGLNGGKAIYIVNDSAHRKKNKAANYVDYGEKLKVGADDFTVALWYKTDAAGVSAGDTANDDHGGNDVSLFGNKDYNSGTNVGLTLGNFSAQTPADVRVNFVANKGTRVEISKVSVCDDAWHHLAAAFDRDGNMSVYVDGKLFGTKSISTYKGVSLDVAGQNFVLGADGVHTYGTPGAAVDELSLYKGALTAAEVQRLYRKDAPRTENADGLILHSGFDDGTANDDSGRYNDGAVTSDSQYGGVSFVEGLNGGKAVYIVNDSAHRKKNKAANYVDYGENLKVGANDFSVSLWYKTDAAGVSAGDGASDDHGGNDVSLFGNKDYNSGTNVGLTLGNFSANDPADVRVNFVANKGTRVEISKVSVCDDVWHHLAAAFDRDGNMSVYVDGKLFGTKSISTYKGVSLDVAGQSFVLGADGVHNYGTPGAAVDELRMYSKALSAEDVTGLYELDRPKTMDEFTTLNLTFDDGTAKDSSASKTDGTIVGGVQFVDGIKGKAVKISNDADHRKANTAGQYINFGKQPGVRFGDGDFTLAFWYKSEDHGASDAALMGNKDYTSGSNIGLAVGNYRASATKYLDDVRMNVSGVQGERKEIKDISANNDQWHYLVTSFDRGGDMVVYMDGRKISSLSISSQKGKSFDAGDFVIGADGYLHYGADGCTLDEVRIIKKALNADESTDLYRSQALSLRLDSLGAMTKLASGEQYGKADVDAFLAVYNRIEEAAKTASEAEAVALYAELEEAYAALQNSAKKALVSFDVLSDVHLRDSDASRAGNFVAGLQDIAENHPGSNALLTAGDNISFGSDNKSRTQYFDLIAQYADQIPNKLIALGNHDVRKNDSSSSTGFSSNWAVARPAYMASNKIYRDDPESDNTYFDKWVNGYHFIVLNTEEGLKDSASLSAAQLAWFEQKLGQAQDGAKADPEKPVFVMVHQGLNDTHPRANAYSGFGDQDAQVKEILQKHPQAILMSGHIHNGLGVSTTIDRAYGTLIDLPSFNESENGITANGTGYQVDVYGDRVHFRARNYITHTWLPEFDVILALPSLSVLTAEGSAKTEAEYTAGSWSGFDSALAAAKDVLNGKNENMRLSVMETAVALNNAIDSLRADMSGLQTLYHDNKDKKADDYTPSSWKGFPQALADAEAVLGNELSTPDKVKTTQDALSAALAALKKRADAGPLQVVYDANLGKDAAKYTPATWEGFEKAMNDADALLKNFDATQEALDDALDALEKAAADLTERADNKALQELFNDNSKKENQGFTAASWARFQKALADAEALLGNPNATEARVKAAEEELEAAAAGLVKEENPSQNPSENPSGGSSQGGSSGGQSGSDTPVTGEAPVAPALLLIVFGAASIAVLALLKFRREGVSTDND